MKKMMMTVGGLLALTVLVVSGILFTGQAARGASFAVGQQNNSSGQNTNSNKKNKKEKKGKKNQNDNSMNSDTEMNSNSMNDNSMNSNSMNSNMNPNTNGTPNP